MDHSSPSHDSFASTEYENIEEFTSSFNSPTSSSRNNVPSLRISTSLAESFPTSPITPVTRSPQKFKNKDRARTESRKLLAHVLAQLEHRNLPPSIFDVFDNNDDAKPDNNLEHLFEAVKDTVKRQRRDVKQQQPGAGEDDEEDEEEREFSTDETHDLVLQLRDLLIMSVSQGWRIFDESSTRKSQNYAETDEKPAISPFRLPTNNLQPRGHGQRSRSPSPSNAKQSHAPHLLDFCISILASIVSEDCRYKVASPRPSRPPNALQALVLDVASFLLYLHRGNPDTTAKIGSAIIPAFSTFPPEMHGRLLTFFENFVMRGVLEDLEQNQGIHEVAFGHSGVNKPLQSSSTSSVAIHIDSVEEDLTFGHEQPHWSKWSSIPDAALRLRSTYAPFQSTLIYTLSSLVAPLLAAILGSVDLEPSADSSTNVQYRFCSLLRLIIDKKVDAYMDLLQIISHNTPQVRHKALSILCNIWPAAVGHIVISEPFARSYQFAGLGLSPRPARHSHQFTPWRFSSYQNRPKFYGFSHSDCCSCSQPIRGFGLFCPLCICGVHFDCYDYPEGNHLLQYPLISDVHVQRVAMYRFSIFQTDHSAPDSFSLQSHGHNFSLVNLFTLCLCAVCKEPLWGCSQQGVYCLSCSRFMHSACLTTLSASSFIPCSSLTPNSDQVFIDWKDLRESCFKFYQGILSFEYEELAMRSFEEISIIHAILWIQLQLLTNGIAMGSVVVMRHGKNAVHSKKNSVDEFELHHTVRWCEDLLSSGILPRSDATNAYVEENRLNCSEYFMMFDWTNLTYITSILKSPYTDQCLLPSSSSDNLGVAQAVQSGTSASPGYLPPFELVPLSHMRDALGYGQNVYSDVIARLLLLHLYQIGLFHRVDGVPALFDGDSATDIYCYFPIPFGLDLSSTVETVVSTVEACLSDADLSTNEVGLLLLVRRFWPNGLASDYALRRLTRSVSSWILAEDDHLTAVLHDYVEKRHSLPGVRSTQDPIVWPPIQAPRSNQSSSVHNGGDYLATRRALLSRYVVPWLLDLHDLDSIAYAAFIYEGCMEAEVIFPMENQFECTEDSQTKEGLRNRCDRILRSIVKLTHLSVVYDVFDDLLLHWLESTIIHDLYDKPMPSLLKLFPRDSEIFASHSAQHPEGMSDETSIDPWRVITRTTSEDLPRTLKWLYLLACSGVEIPLRIFKETAFHLGNRSSLIECLLFAKVTLCSTWLRSRGRQEIQAFISELHARLAPHIVNLLRHESQTQDCISFIRITLATCSLLYGCDRSRLIELGLIKNEDINGLPSRRKVNIRGSAVVDPMIIDSRLLETIEKCTAISVEEITCLAVKFLHLFLTDSPYLEPYEVDNFILRNGKLLATCAWQAYEVQHTDLSSLRPHFLLRTLVVDSEPFRDILETWFLPTSGWERRLLSVTRLFRIVLDINNPSFGVEDRQWKSSVHDIFYYFFTSLWSDGREEVRLAVDSFSASLLPAHFNAISACWNESLPKMSITERIRLVTFLIQLHPHFPRWPVLSWDALVEALQDDAVEQQSATVRSSMSGAQPPPNDPDLASLRASIVYLSLQLISDGISIDGFMLLKLKNNLLQISGFRNVAMIHSQTGQSSHVRFGDIIEIPTTAHPCINQLLAVMDAPYSVDLAPAAMVGANELDERPASVLVGSVFVDMFLSTFCMARDLASLPVLIFKNMLETLGVIIYKHDFESKTLRHLQQALRRAVTRALEYLTKDIPYDLRQLTLSVIQAFLKRWHSFMGSVVFAAIESVVKLIASQSQHGQDALAAQARTFLDVTLTKYSQNGLFANLMKRSLQPDFFAVIEQVTEANAKNNPASSPSLREALLRDIFSRTIESDGDGFRNVLNNIRVYMEVVFREGYSSELLQFIGQQMINFARRSSELPPDKIDPGPLLDICATLVHHNRSRGREVLSYIDTVLRVLLNRLNVHSDRLTRLIQVANQPNRKSQGIDAVSNTVILLMFEILEDGLRLKIRVPSFTLRSLLQTVTTAEITGSLSPVVGNLPSFLELIDPGINFLQNHIWHDVDNDFAASLAVARMLFQVSEQDPTIMNKLVSYGLEKAIVTNLKVRSWSMLVIAALLETNENWHTALFAHIQSFSYAHHNALRTYIHGVVTSEFSTADVNHAYIAIKLWILLVYKVSGGSDFYKDSQAYSVWNELWPPFEALISQFEVDLLGQHLQNLATLVISSIADLFVFLRTLHSPLALHTSNHVATLNRLSNLGHGGTHNQKVSRALRYMSESPPEASFETLVSQATKDIIVAEKLRMVETKFMQERRAPERYKRDLRVMT